MPKRNWGKHMDNLKTYAAPLGRLLMSSLFIWAGYNKLFVFGPARRSISQACTSPVPELRLGSSSSSKLLGGMLIFIGFQTRWVALVLAIFCLITGFGVHLPVGDNPNMINFYKNLAMAGGFLYVFAAGAGVLSIDGQGK